MQEDIKFREQVIDESLHPSLDANFVNKSAFLQLENHQQNSIAHDGLHITNYILPAKRTKRSPRNIAAKRHSSNVRKVRAPINGLAPLNLGQLNSGRAMLNGHKSSIP